MDKNKQLAEALTIDYLELKQTVDEMKNEGWKIPNNYWIKILTNLMHRGNNGNTLFKRTQKESYKAAEKFDEIVKISDDDRKKLLLDFVPGSRTMKKEKKVDLLLDIINKIKSKGGLEKCFMNSVNRNDLLLMLTQFKGVGCKIARNVYMDLYHPAFRNGTIPIDINWTKIGLYLGEKWKNPCTDETKILNWRKAYIERHVVEEDWEFDRLLYQSLQKKHSNVNKLIRQHNPKLNSTTSSKITKMSPQLLVANIKSAIEFYTKKLGFEVDFRYEDFYAGIIKDGYSIHLKLDESSIEERKSKRNHDDLEITFQVDNIDSLYEELSNKSVAFTQSLRDMPYGREFYVADPDRNIIAFLEV